jgi:hypothetical protein
VVKVPSGQGLAATAKAFAGVMAGVWAGSQVTKAPRAAAALMLAPLVDRLMGALQEALGLRSRRQVSQVEPHSGQCGRHSACVARSVL